LYSGGSATTAADLSELMKVKIAAPQYLLHTHHMIRWVEVLLKVFLAHSMPLLLPLNSFVTVSYPLKQSFTNCISFQPSFTVKLHWSLACTLRHASALVEFSQCWIFASFTMTLRLTIIEKTKSPFQF
jgi:hypothetical protein